MVAVPVIKALSFTVLTRIFAYGMVCWVSFSFTIPEMVTAIREKSGEEKKLITSSKRGFLKVVWNLTILEGYEKNVCS